MKGLVLKKNAGLFEVESEKGLCNIKALGNVKKSGLYVGDEVEFDGVITKVYPRRNRLIRPPLANLSRLFIVIASTPKPDYVLVDKLLLYCYVSGIEPTIVVNKADIFDNNFEKEVKSIYNKVVPIIFTSAQKCELGKLRNEIKGVCAFAGQSAVGKSSLINALLGGTQAEVGGLSRKVERGKQTTRMTSLYKLENGYIADTAGFSLLDAALVLPIEPHELSKYYPDFLESLKDCKFRSCTHETAGNCAVIEAVKKGLVNSTRYNNYLKILSEIKEAK